MKLLPGFGIDLENSGWREQQIGLRWWWSPNCRLLVAVLPVRMAVTSTGLLGPAPLVVWWNPNVRSCRCVENDRNDVGSRSRRDDILGVVIDCDLHGSGGWGSQHACSVAALSATLPTVAVVSFHLDRDNVEILLARQ